MKFIYTKASGYETSLQTVRIVYWLRYTYNFGFSVGKILLGMFMWKLAQKKCKICIRAEI